MVTRKVKGREWKTPAVVDWPTGQLACGRWPPSKVVKKGSLFAKKGPILQSLSFKWSGTQADFAKYVKKIGLP